MNKRGLSLSLNFVIELIIAVICVLILYMLAFALWSIVFPNQNELNQAKGQLNTLYQEISNIPFESKIDFVLVAPGGWHLVSFGKEPSPIKVQELCKNENCLCICRKGLITIDCAKKAVCRVIDKPFLENGEYVNIEIMSKIEITNKGESYDIVKK